MGLLVTERVEEGEPWILIQDLGEVGEEVGKGSTTNEVGYIGDNPTLGKLLPRHFATQHGCRQVHTVTSEELAASEDDEEEGHWESGTNGKSRYAWIICRESLVETTCDSNCQKATKANEQA